MTGMRWIYTVVQNIGTLLLEVPGDVDIDALPERLRFRRVCEIVGGPRGELITMPWRSQATKVIPREGWIQSSRIALVLPLTSEGVTACEAAWQQLRQAESGILTAKEIPLNGKLGLVK